MKDWAAGQRVGSPLELSRGQMTESALEESAASGTVESAVRRLLSLELNLTCSKYNDSIEPFAKNK